MALVLPVNDIHPQIGADCWLAPNATVVGDVVLGRGCTVWFTAVIRGDVHQIRIGDETNIQDGAVLHCTYQRADLHIGARVTIGHRAIVHGCHVEDEVLIGMGAILLNGATIGSDSIVAAGTLVTEGTVIPPRSLVMGSPGKVRRELTDAEVASILDYATRYVGYRLDYMTSEARG